VPNSVTILPDLLPVAVELAERKVTGVVNFTNPGTLSHNEILDLYRQYIDPEYKYENFSLDEQAKILKAGRSNNELVHIYFNFFLIISNPFPHFILFHRTQASFFRCTLAFLMPRTRSLRCSRGCTTSTSLLSQRESSSEKCDVVAKWD